MNKYKIIIGILLCISIPVIASTPKSLETSLTGKIKDKETGIFLPGVSIYIPDLKIGTISDNEGKYKLENLPAKKLLIQVSFTGYKSIIETIDLSIISNKDFELEPSIIEIEEIVITGTSEAEERNRTPAPMSIITNTELMQNSSSNIIDAIAKQPGISQITTGTGISKPVIRGLGYNRVVVVKDGIRQEGQQWGDEHGIEIDEFSIDKVEILKGPASLSYGSDAIAGVANMLTQQILPNGKIVGNITSNYQTNNGTIGYSADIAGNLKGLIWDMRYSNKIAHAYQNKYDGYVFNSGFRESSISGLIGLNKSWGYTHLNFSSYNFTPGIVEGERDSLTGKFTKTVLINDSTSKKIIASDKDNKSYTPLTPYQKIHHYKLVSNNSFIIGESILKTTFGFQQNQRQEYADIFNINNYGLYFLLNTINYDIRYILPDNKDLNISFGTNGMQQTSLNKGSEFLIPDYKLFDMGVFTIVKKKLNKLDICGGIRYDLRAQNGNDLFLNSKGTKTNIINSSSTHKFTAFKNTFNGISGSIGSTYQFSDKLYSKLNISRGYRAPNIAELSSNGVHEGTNRYEIGNSSLKAEYSLQFDLAIGYHSKYISAELDLFHNLIDNFIYSRKLNNIYGKDSLTDEYSTFKFYSGNATIMGGEISVDIHPHPLDWLHFENAFSYVQTEQKNQPDSTRYLPLTPAPKLQSTLRAETRHLSKHLHNPYIKFELENYFRQNKYFSAYNTETATPAYTLINVGAGSDLVLKDKIICSIYLSINNLTDVAYQSHLSRLKYAPENFITGRTGIYNMGRDISIKLNFPFNFKKS
ncbi:MAG: TonB-dependent receptor [Bacteroidota bacterium]|nr:TonB-dependent receptor [Bacteroidota bacterium]